MNKIISYLGIGSNIGNTKDNLDSAIKILNESKNCKILQVSRFYKTKPVGLANQPDFLNAVVKIETLLSPEDLLKLINIIENKLGRVRTIKWGPRTIDIDILIYGNININKENLIIPHPAMMERAFVLEPLSEIEPNMILPNGENISEVLDRIKKIQ
jgi:2-amino-4-hydroxy-6-hydroxymethyldihydropteridine diphosphokinase